MQYSILCASFWALTGIFVKLLGELSVPQILWGRFFIALVVSLLLFGRLSSWKKPASPFKHLGLALLMTSYYFFATFSFSLAPVSLAVLVIATAPLFAFLLQLTQTRTINFNQIIGFAITFGGLALYLQTQHSSGQLQFNLAFLAGAVCALGAAVVRALFSFLIWLKSRRGEIVDASAINLQTMASGALLLLPLLLVQGNNLPAYQDNLLLILGLGVLATTAPNLLNTLAVTKIDPTTHNIIGMSTPISASLIAWLLLGEAQTVYSCFAIAITVAGILVALLPKKAQPQLSAEKA
ncbi:DMT family transporter [Halioxenophilus sp. WMMB6]|uniref:DMT family transporter n=1 Tax=Halioxenophilus sp. WMMB6 TaxID=3073815 RepID=UPI00295E9BC4|nr:DMT family transporter [Halioxenophilus sp. WMMB6]